ncbi:MAG: terpene cyclase/mutase family protein [bacterium]|nr:terpene cyclase/mutase family protein [bacterium]
MNKPPVKPPLASAKKPPATSTAAPQALPDDVPEEGGGFFSHTMLFQGVPSWFVSMMVHAVMIVVLAVWTITPPPEQGTAELVIDRALEDADQVEEFQFEEIDPVDVETFTDAPQTELTVQTMEVPTEITEVGLSNDIEMAAVAVDLVEFSSETAPKNDLMTEIGATTGTGLQGRGTAKARGSAVAKYGGSKGSEAAVAAALKWIAEHQYPDGGWSFDHSRGSCAGQCRNAGTMAEARRGATAMALLPFLGAGQTHLEGDYKETVRRGLLYLISQQKSDGSFHEGGGRMYSHGLAAICMTEAYAMTHDRDLERPAQASLNFITAAQDPVGGGWRYSPKQAGDTSAVGWQIMALKSGHMGYLVVPPNTVKGATAFLDSVSQESGAYYGYTGPGKGSATTAVGLLCRMYLGWKQDNPALERGVQYLDKTGPSATNMYFNYYATQVMRQYGGDPWEKWNNKMRDQLVNSQEKKGHENGSWYFNGGHGATHGGRLYNTSMSTMTLEVYYRHLPIYRKQATTEDFPL